MLRRNKTLLLRAGFAILSLASVSQLYADPRIDNCPVRGLQIGGTTRLTIQGPDLLPNSQIVSSCKLAQVTVVEATNNNNLVVDVTLPGDVPAGIYSLRVANEKGISEPIWVGANGVAQTVAKPEAQLPFSVHAAINGSQIYTVKFAGKAKQRINVDLVSRRIGGQLKPVMRLLDANKKQIAFTNPLLHLNGDARLSAELPVDGDYYVSVHDLVMRAAPQSYFQLTVSESTFSKGILPIGVSAVGSQAEKVAVLTSNGLQETELPVQPSDLNGWQLANIGTNVAGIGVAPHRWASPWSAYREIEAEHKEIPSAGTAPISVTGRLLAGKEVDSYRVTVAPNTPIRFELFSQRIGYPLDAVVIVRNVQGQELGRSDDQPATADPGLTVNVPADVTELRVDVSSLTHQGGEDAIYNLHVYPANKPSPSLSLTSSRIEPPTNGASLIRVPIARNGFAGEIELSLYNPGSGITAPPVVVPPQSEVGLLAVTATSPVPGSLTKVIARFPGSDLPPVVAELPENQVSKVYPWFRSEVGVMTVANAAPTVIWTGIPQGPIWAGAAIPLTVTVERPAGVAGPVRFGLATTQKMPRKKIFVNNKEEEVDAVEQSFRLDSVVVIEDGQGNSAPKLLVPGSATDAKWGYALTAEILTADKNGVVVSTASPVAYLETKQALKVEIAADKPVTATKGQAEPASLSGKVTWVNGFAAAVQVKFVGLPANYESAPVVVASDKPDFTVQFKVPADAKPEDLKNLYAVAVALDEQGNQIAASPEVKVNVDLK